MDSKEISDIESEVKAKYEAELQVVTVRYKKCLEAIEILRSMECTNYKLSSEAVLQVVNSLDSFTVKDIQLVLPFIANKGSVNRILGNFVKQGKIKVIATGKRGRGKVTTYKRVDNTKLNCTCTTCTTRISALEKYKKAKDKVLMKG